MSHFPVKPSHLCNLCPNYLDCSYTGKAIRLSPCTVRCYILKKYGKKTDCTPNGDPCTADCQISIHECDECGNLLIRSSDPCSGILHLCLNPDCSMDK